MPEENEDVEWLEKRLAKAERLSRSQMTLLKFLINQMRKQQTPQLTQEQLTQFQSLMETQSKETREALQAMKDQLSLTPQPRPNPSVDGPGAANPPSDPQPQPRSNPAQAHRSLRRI